MSLIFLQGICGMSYGKISILSVNETLIFQGLLISSFCEQEIEVMEVALGSVFPILLISGTFSFKYI
jgi:hypothetical protein